MFAAVTPLPVDPTNDWLAYANASLAAVGGFAGVIAIIIALRAQRAADRTVAEERRRVFELEVLRELMQQISSPALMEEIFSHPNHLRRFDFQISLLTSRLEFWEKIAASRDPGQVIDAVGLGAEHQAAVDKAVRINEERQRNYQRLAEARDELLWPSAGAVGDADPVGDFAQADSRQQELLGLEHAAEEKVALVRAQVPVRLGEKLAWDLKQAVLSRVEAGRPARRNLFQRWWYRV